jgi:hypothetical protein
LGSVHSDREEASRLIPSLKNLLLQKTITSIGFLMFSRIYEEVRVIVTYHHRMDDFYAL